MKRAVFISAGVLACVFGLTGLFFIGTEHFLYFMAATSALSAITLLYSPNNDVNSVRSLLLIFIAAVSIMIILTSCSRQGYGCHGRGKYITRVR